MLVFVVSTGSMDCGCASVVGSPGFDSVAPDRCKFGDDTVEAMVFQHWHCLKAVREELHVWSNTRVQQ